MVDREAAEGIECMAFRHCDSYEVVLCVMHEIEDTAAMSKIRNSWATACLLPCHFPAPGSARYCSYTRKKVGRWRTGSRGAHSWKKMLMYWSDRIRGGILDEPFGVLDGAGAHLTCTLKDSA